MPASKMQRRDWWIPASLILLSLVPAIAAWHCLAGRALGVCGLVAALSGLWMAQFYPWPAGDGYGVYVERLVFGTAMAASIILGIESARRRDFTTHGAWMIRAYAIGLGAGTQVLTHLPWFILVGKPGETARTVLMGAGWVINVAVAEWIIRRPRARGVTARSVARSGEARNGAPTAARQRAASLVANEM